MENYFNYPEGIENNIEWKINNKNAIYYVSECSKTGGILPKGIQIYSESGSLTKDNKRMSGNAAEKVKVILNSKERVADIICHINNLMSLSDEEKTLLIDEKDRADGIYFKLAGAKNYNSEYIIELPDLYAIVNKSDDDNANCICFYGDKPKLENCTHVAMHICGSRIPEAKERFILLTPVPEEWLLTRY